MNLFHFPYSCNFILQVTVICAFFFFLLFITIIIIIIIIIIIVIFKIILDYVICKVVQKWWKFPLLSLFSSQSTDFLEMLKDVGFDIHHQNFIIRRMIIAAIRSTYFIFCRRNKDWDSPELLKF